jgi:hypothetical protein
MFSRRVAILLEFVFWLPHESDHIVPNTMKQNFIDGVVPLRPFVSLLLLLLLWRSVDTVSGRGIDFRFLRDDCITSHHITSHHKARSRIGTNAIHSIRIGRHSCRYRSSSSSRSGSRFFHLLAFGVAFFFFFRRPLYYTTLPARRADSCRNSHSQRPPRCNPCTTSGVESCSRLRLPCVAVVIFWVLC